MLTSEHVELWGDRSVQVFRGGTGPQVVWLHGPHGIRGHDPLLAELTKRHTVIAPVAPGFNDVEELSELRDVHDLALHYDDILEALGLDGITLIGHSFGAMVAAELAAHFPRRVRKLVLISPFGLWRDDHPVADLFTRPYTTVDQLLWKSGAASPAMSNPADDPNDPVERGVKLVQAMTTVAKYIWPIPDKGLRRRLPRVSAETLVIFGADDAFVPPIYAGEFTGAIRNARSAVIADAGHMVAYEKPDDVLALIAQHLGTAARAA